VITLQTMKAVMALAAGAVTNHQAMLAFWNDEAGQDLLEFALVAALLALCAVATLKGLAADVEVLWGGVQSDLSKALS
jgi:Flp pilus assembly pilin Flp